MFNPVLSTYSADAPARWPTRVAYAAIGVVVLINLVMLLAYQQYLRADFPFQDEIGYLNRLHHLPQTGFGHYLLDRYYTYFMPSYMFIWYGFYKLTHLNIQAVRYTGAVVSALVSLVLSIMLYRRANRADLLTFSAILSAPFIICSYNDWASYNQSMESVAEPLIFGLVLCLLWVAEKAIQAVDRGAKISEVFLWTSLFIAGWIFASLIYPPPLVLLGAAVGARWLLSRRFDASLTVLAIIAIAAPLIYLTLASGLSTQWSASRTTFGIREVLSALDAAVALSGNSLLSPATEPEMLVTRVLGLALVVGQLACATYTLRLPADQRSRFFIPLAMMLYTGLVILEVVATRLHSPGVGFTPRYAMFTLGGPVSLMFWLVLLPSGAKWRSAIGAGILALGVVGVGAADRRQVIQLPYTRAAMARVRLTMMSLHAAPNPEQQSAMYVNAPLLPYVYPDVEFLRQERLAMYRGESAQAPSIGVSENALLVTGFGPDNIRAKQPFHVIDGQSSMWLTTDRPLAGDVYVEINGTRLRAFHHDSVVSIAVPRVLYSKPGLYPMYVVEINGATTAKSNRVDFVVH